MRPATQPPGPGQWDQGRRPASPAHARLPPPPLPARTFPPTTHHTQEEGHTRAPRHGRRPWHAHEQRPWSGGGCAHTHTHTTPHPILSTSFTYLWQRHAGQPSCLVLRRGSAVVVGLGGVGGWVGARGGKGMNQDGSLSCAWASLPVQPARLLPPFPCPPLFPQPCALFRAARSQGRRGGGRGGWCGGGLPPQGTWTRGSKRTPSGKVPPGTLP